MSEQRSHSRSELSFLDKLFPGLILLCMAGGLALGRLAPDVGHLFEPLIPLGLFLMIYPTVTKVPFHALQRSAVEWRPAFLSIVLNYLINPVLLFAFGWLFLRHYPDLWTGLILLGIAPCIGMVLVWADLGGADNPLSVSPMAWNSLIQKVRLSASMSLLAGFPAYSLQAFILPSSALCVRQVPVARTATSSFASALRQGASSGAVHPSAGALSS